MSHRTYAPAGRALDWSPDRRRVDGNFNLLVSRMPCTCTYGTTSFRTARLLVYTTTPICSTPYLNNASVRHRNRRFTYSTRSRTCAVHSNLVEMRSYRSICICTGHKLAVPSGKSYWYVLVAMIMQFFKASLWNPTGRDDTFEKTVQCRDVLLGAVRTYGVYIEYGI